MTGPRVEALIARLAKGRRKTREILGRLSEREWQALVYAEPTPWTVRDLLAHFYSTEEALLRLCQDTAAGRDSVPEDFDFDTFNMHEQSRLADRSAQDLLAALETARQRTLDWLATLQDDDLDRISRHPVLGAVTLEAMVTAIYGHQLMHMRDLQTMLG
jgi:uncharacterized damage-inducible protein DinB